MAKRHYKITLADILQAHEDALTFGGLSGTPNLGMVEAAIARPYNGYYRRVEQKCAAMVESVAGNHGFADGNKRTALLVLNIFIDRSGYALVPIPGEDMGVAIEQMIVDVVTHQLTFEQTCAWFKARLKRT